MPSYPGLWKCLKCHSYITVNTVTNTNFREINGLAEIYCYCCKEWHKPAGPNGELK